MPETSRFLGIVIAMYYKDHAPPHFHARYGAHEITVRIADGVEGDVDLKAELFGEVFEPLKDPEVFRAFHVDVELNTISWPSGADLAPEFLYEQAAQRAAASDVATRCG